MTADTMRFSVFGLFIVGVATPCGGRLKGRPVAFIEAADQCRLTDLLLPDKLEANAMETYISEKFAAFALPGQRLVRLQPQASSGQL